MGLNWTSCRPTQNALGLNRLTFMPYDRLMITRQSALERDILYMKCVINVQRKLR